ncbi:MULTISPECIES: hypothetical protein [Streptomyces]|uniref:IS1 family transposase n=1 Tax=Streptomyces albus (strain ATCC 21838 / DSM 41398 / FERM P-419 / JCM 4703 / NBRC 107858) TaxID=1081613 RepID=A0A0B5ESA0_STRA4|nr:hypothetical protein [Streptomyces sp. SCSIO ZS0520]AJE85678.1 hypothetical protein SLNWT_5302 [Streptomyces albus]AOU79980.1 hypothetical protein SLNHY_5289 [Streptomyces albus]AYN35697.1 hypothetical protein DUI70_5201 [Streptomyces albus]
MPARNPEEIPLLGVASSATEAASVRTHLNCPSCGSAHVAQVLGDNGGVSYVCTACGHSWS